MKILFTFLSSTPKRFLMGCGVLYLSGYLVFSYSERSQHVDDISTSDFLTIGNRQITDTPFEENVDTPSSARAPASISRNHQTSGQTSQTNTSRANRKFHDSSESHDDYDNHTDDRGARPSRVPRGSQEYYQGNQFGQGLGGSFRNQGASGAVNNAGDAGGPSGLRSPQNLGGGFGETFGSDSSAESNNFGSTNRFTSVASEPDNSQLTEPICSHDMAEGTYGASLNVSLSCSESSTIYYCVQTGGGCCDPFQSGSIYSGAINIGPTDDDYCISYYGVANQSMLESSLKNVSYTLDSVPPSLLTSYPMVRVQTTQTPVLNFTQSLDFGSEDTYYHQVNLKTHDPVDMSWDCEDILLNYQSLTSPSSIPLALDYDVSGLDVTDQVDQTIALDDLNYGVNFVSTVLEDGQRNLFSCQTHLVTLEDFPMFSIPTQGPADTYTDSSYGWFSPFGHFEVTPNTTAAGQGKDLQGDKYLRYGHWSITH